MNFTPQVSEILNSRQKYLPNYCYKLADGQFATDFAFSRDAEVNENEMSVIFPFADGKNRDSVGDLLEVGGIRTDRHQKNPIVLVDHGKTYTMPVGVTEDPKTKEYTVYLDPVSQSAYCKAFFYQDDKNSDHALFCEQLFDLMAKKFIRAGSIGYQVISARELPANYERGTPKGLHLLSTMMLEASAVVLPCNQDTVRKALCMPKVCGKPLSPMLVKSLTPYLPKDTKEIVSVPLNEDLSKTDVPPAAWKPGVGAVKDIYALRKKYAVSNSMQTKTKAFPDKDKEKNKGENPPKKEREKENTGPIEDEEEMDETPPADAASPVPKNSPPAQTQPPAAPAAAPPNPAPMSQAPASANTPVDGGVEKLSAQVLRRVHQDHLLLMQDYDEFTGLLENPEILGWVQAKLQSIEQELTAIEGLFGKHHPNLPPIEGSHAAAGGMAIPTGGVDPTAQQPTTPGEVGGSTQADAPGVGDEDMEADTDAVLATDTPKDVPSPDEAVEGMKVDPAQKKKEIKNKSEKSLPEAKAKCMACGKEGCECDKKAMPKGAKCSVGCSEGKDMESPTLFDYELQSAKDAHTFLKQLSKAKDFGDEHRMKSYHFYKTLQSIASYRPKKKGMDSLSMEDAAPESMGEMGEMALKSIAGDYNWLMEEGMEDMHPHRKCCGNVSNYFKRMTMEKSFGNAHREEAITHMKAMEPIVNPMGEMPPGAGHVEGDDMGDVKDIDEREFHKSFTEDQKTLETLRKTLEDLQLLVA